MGLAWLSATGRATPASSSKSRTPLIVVAALDRSAIQPVLDAFSATHPSISLNYQDLSTREVNRRIRDSDNPPDVVISSAMPSQMSQVNAGYAQALSTRETRAWPARAKWRDEVFGFTFEPVVFAYRRDLANRMSPPQSHGALYRALQVPDSPLANGHMALYDPARSDVGYALYQADAGYTARFWQLVSAMGKAQAVQVGTTRTMLEGLSSGRFVFAYNLIGSYALRWAKTHPEIVVRFPRDYTLVLSRMVFVHRQARHLHAAVQFVDFLLSHAGQKILANDTPLFSRRKDVSGPYSAWRLRAEVGDHLFPIPIDAGLMAISDPQKRRTFLRRWQREYQDQTQPNASSSAPPREH
ncbi:ABC transporter substrate-binding protein [Salinisphaera hydrothermalis]|nr:ABC transporter substrate-binding protein [Salinisphaera hydrothermalis]